MSSFTNNKNNPVTVYHCSPGVSWAVENWGLLLINGSTGETKCLSYPEAALWDFLSREIPLQKIISMLSVIVGTGSEAARAMAAAAVDAWVRGGWLTREAPDG